MAEREKIGVGFRVGMLTVEGPTEKRKAGYMVWRCRCDCGGEILLDTRNLQRKTVTDCGCRTKVRPGQLDISGMRFGKLTALESTGRRGMGNTIIWRCHCDCGNEVLVPLHQLRSGYRKSCGCLAHPPRKALIGKRFGKLTVTGYVGKDRGMHRWKCICDCGRETVVGQTLLLSGKTKSCGCLQATVFQDNLKLVEGTSITVLEANLHRLNKNNTSGHTGVYWDKRREKWTAQIGFKGKTYYLGAYEEKEEAVAARLRGEEMHTDFLKWYYQQYPAQKTGTAK